MAVKSTGKGVHGSKFKAGRTHKSKRATIAGKKRQKSKMRTKTGREKEFK